MTTNISTDKSASKYTIRLAKPSDGLGIAQCWYAVCPLLQDYPIHLHGLMLTFIVVSSDTID